MLTDVYAEHQYRQLCEAVARLAAEADEAVRAHAGQVYAARNLLELCPEIITLWRTEELVRFVIDELGPEAGLVRGLYFDKPPEQTWALPWHKDLLIAVNSHSQPPGFSKPRPRAGVLHTEPPIEILEQMLTLRIHLDPMTPENGPLEVRSGSHLTGKKLDGGNFETVQLHAAPGDVLAMRPLLVHASGRSSPETISHRRIVHLEFCGRPELVPGDSVEKLAWHMFIPIQAADSQ